MNFEQGYNPNTSAFMDASLIAVILGNLLSIIMAFYMSWDMGEIMWIYWSQSVIIGILNFVRIMSLKEFSTENFKMNDQAVDATDETKRQVAWFFAFHYGFFHLGYAAFLWQEMTLNTLSQQDAILLLLCISAFFTAHRFSLRHNAKTDFKQKKPNIGTLMFYPYLRIVPMHLTIIFGGMIGGAGALIIFMTLKTLADAGMHMVEHHLFRKPSQYNSK